MKNLAAVLLTALLSVAAFDATARSEHRQGTQRSQVQRKVAGQPKKMKKAKKVKKARKHAKNKIKKNKAKRQQKANS